MLSKKIYECPVCKKEFKIKKVAYNHIISCVKKNNEENITCFCCGKTYKKAGFFINHLKNNERKNSQKKILKCEFCGKKYKNKKSYEKHFYNCEIGKRIRNIKENNKISGFLMYSSVINHSKSQNKEISIINYLKKKHYYEFFENLDNWLEDNFLYMNSPDRKIEYIQFCLTKNISYKKWKNEKLVKEFIRRKWLNSDLKNEIKNALKYINNFVEKVGVKKEENLIKQYFSFPFYIIMQHIISTAINPIIIFATKEGKTFYDNLAVHEKDELKKIIGDELLKKLKLKSKMNKIKVEQCFKKYIESDVKNEERNISSVQK